MKTFSYVCIIIFLAIVLSVGCFGLNYIKGLYQQTITPELAVERYEWYEQQIRDIKAIEGQIKDAEDSVKRFKEDNGPSSKWGFIQVQEYERLNSNVTGLRSAKRGMIEAYNARASMITRSMWKSSTLPYHIDQE